MLPKSVFLALLPAPCHFCLSPEGLIKLVRQGLAPVPSSSPALPPQALPCLCMGLTWLHYQISCPGLRTGLLLLFAHPFIQCPVVKCPVCAGPGPLMTPTLEKLLVRRGDGHTCRGRLCRASALREGSRRDEKPRGEPSAVRQDGREGFLGVLLSQASKVK